MKICSFGRRLARLCLQQKSLNAWGQSTAQVATSAQMYFRNAAGNSGIIWCPLLVSHSAGNSTPTEQFKNEKWTHPVQGKLFNPGYLPWVFKPLHSVSLLIWTGKVWDKERSDFYLKLCQPKQSEGLVLQWRLVMVEWETWSGQSSKGHPKEPLGCAGGKMRWGK